MDLREHTDPSSRSPYPHLRHVTALQHHQPGGLQRQDNWVHLQMQALESCGSIWLSCDSSSDSKTMVLIIIHLRIHSVLHVFLVAFVCITYSIK
jgi:hypothetical protein